MKNLLSIIAVALVTATNPVWAGPAEEVAELAAKRGQAFSQGNAEAFAADFADNAVFTSSRATFRIEGKAAIRSYFASLFQTYPMRQSSARQAVSRVFGDSLVVVNSYADQTWVDRGNVTTTVSTRSNTIWAKIDGKWQTIDWHISKTP